MKKLFALLLPLALLTGSCRKAEEPAPGIYQLTRAGVNHLAGDYIFEGYGVSKTPGSEKVTLSFEKITGNKLKFGGRSYVNLYGGSYTFDEEGGSIIFNELITTEMAAFDHSQNLAEQEYYENFQKIRKFTLEDSTLRLFDTEPASEVMIFRKVK